MNIRTLYSPAKINLALNVVGKKKSLHKIESIVSFINLYDLIKVKEIRHKKHQIIFNGRFSKNIKRDNTITKLLNILDDRNLLKKKKFQIKITKNIPQRAGLGGGSMNAASLLSLFIKKNFFKISSNLEKTCFFHDISFRSFIDVEFHFDANLVPFCFPKSTQNP